MVRDPRDERRRAEFQTFVRSTQRWLERHVLNDDLSPRANVLAMVLRSYLAHCQRAVSERDISEKRIAEWRRKIDDAVIQLMRAGLK